MLLLAADGLSSHAFNAAAQVALAMAHHAAARADAAARRLAARGEEEVSELPPKALRAQFRLSAAKLAAARLEFPDAAAVAVSAAAAASHPPPLGAAATAAAGVRVGARGRGEPFVRRRGARQARRRSSQRRRRELAVLVARPPRGHPRGQLQQRRRRRGGGGGAAQVLTEAAAGARTAHSAFLKRTLTQFASDDPLAVFEASAISGSGRCTSLKASAAPAAPVRFNVYPGCRTMLAAPDAVMPKHIHAGAVSTLDAPATERFGSHRLSARCGAADPRKVAPSKTAPELKSAGMLMLAIEAPFKDPRALHFGRREARQGGYRAWDSGAHMRGRQFGVGAFAGYDYGGAHQPPNAPRGGPLLR